EETYETTFDTTYFTGAADDSVGARRDQAGGSRWNVDPFGARSPDRSATHAATLRWNGHGCGRREQSLATTDSRCSWKLCERHLVQARFHARYSPLLLIGRAPGWPGVRGRRRVRQWHQLRRSL